MSGDSGDQFARALRSLEWMLPEGVTPSDVTTSATPMADGAAPSAILLSDGEDPGLVSGFDSGYGTVSSWRVAPSLEDPRFAIPEGDSFRRYSRAFQPMSRRLDKLMIAKAMKLMPWIVRRRSAPVTLVTSEASPMMQLVDEIMEDRRRLIRIGFRDGSVRTTLIGINSDGEVDRVAKYASGEVDASSLHGEYEALQRLTGIPRLAGRTPVPLAMQDGHLGAMLVTDAFDGSPGPVAVGAWVEDFLRLCISDDTMAMGESSVLEELESSTMRADDQLRDYLAEPLSILSRVMVPRSIVHGDFVPWNVIERHGAAHVFDWETAAFDGFPEWDRVLYDLRSGMTILDWQAEDLIQRVEAFAREGSPFYTAREWASLLQLAILFMHVQRMNARTEPDELNITASTLLRLSGRDGSGQGVLVA